MTIQELIKWHERRRDEEYESIEQFTTARVCDENGGDIGGILRALRDVHLEHAKMHDDTAKTLKSYDGLVMDLEMDIELKSSLRAKSMGAMMKIGTMLGVSNLTYDEDAIVSAVDGMKKRFAVAMECVEFVAGYAKQNRIPEHALGSHFVMVAEEALAKIWGEK